MIAYGHASINFDGRQFDFIPSFANIEKIGEPEEIIRVFKYLNNNDFSKSMFSMAMHVLDCCLVSKDDDLSVLYGSISPNYHGDRILWVNGQEPHQNAVIMARHMLLHGVCGKAKTIDKSEAKPTTEFNASEYVSLARRMLSIGIEEAKKMTMTELLINANEIRKAHESEQERQSMPQDVPTAEEHKNTMDWLAKVNAARANQAK